MGNINRKLALCLIITIFVSLFNGVTLAANSLLLEAEYADVAALAFDRTDYKGFSDAGYKNLLVPGSSLSWENLNSTEDVEVEIKIKYIVNGEADKAIELNVNNGAIKKEVSLPLTDEKWSFASVRISLKKGKNHLQITSLNSNICIDYLEISGGTITQNSAGALKNSKEDKLINTLVSLGIFQGYADGSLQTDDVITRSEFITVVLRLIGVNQEEIKFMNTKQIYNDVPLTHWASNAICYATNLNLISGYDDNNFGPDDPVTFEQAVKIILNVLGYNAIAESKGGYPTGYISTAYEYGLLKGIKMENREALKRIEVAYMIYNALDMNIIEYSSYGDNQKIVIDNQSNVLSRLLGLTYVVGIVEENENTSLFGNSSLREKQVKINGVVYDVGKTNAGDYLGKMVKIYYDDVNTEKEPVIISVEEVNNTELTVYAEEIHEYKDGKLYYTEEGDAGLEYAEISKKADLIYNGKAYPNYTEDVFAIDSGYITFVDNNVDGAYDVIFITSYENYVLDSISTYSNKIFPFYGKNEIVVDPSNKHIKFQLTKDGKPIELNALKKWNVISAAISKDKSLLDLKVIDKKVSGIVTEVMDNEVAINGKFYKVSKSFQEAVESGWAKSIKLDDTGVFYLDIEDKIAATDIKSNQGMNYGYLAKVGVGEGVNKELEFRIYNSSGQWVTLKLAEKVVYNSQSIRAEKLCNDSEVIQQINGRYTAVPQVIMYEVNEQGEISKINTASKDDDIDRFGMSTPKQQLLFKKVGSTFLDDSGTYVEFNVDNSTIIFAVPAPSKADVISDPSSWNAGVPDQGVLDDESKFSIKNISSYNNDGKYWLKAFDKEDGIAKVVVHYTGGGADSSVNIDSQQVFTVIDRVTKTINDDGDATKKIYGFKDGKSFSSFVSSDVDTSNLIKGTVIQYDTNVKNEIQAIKILWSPSETLYSRNGKINDKFCTIYGKITDFINGNALFVTISNDPLNQTKKNSERYDISRAKIYFYDRSTNKVQLGTIDDIEKGAEVFMRIRYVEVGDILIIK